jgi:drug/metabolite transporter (DMT)-like permease
MAPADPSPTPPEGHSVSIGTAAPVLFVALWSTGFVGAKYGLPDAEPFTFLLIRLSIAAALLGLIAAVTRAPWPRSRRAWRHAAVAGLLLHGGYLGGVFYAVDHGVPAGIAAVIVSLQPVITSALVPRLLGDLVGRRAWMGLLLGLAGVALVVVPDAVGSASGALPVAGVVACVIALAATTAGTLYQKRHGPEVPLLSGAAAQYAACSVVLLGLATATETMDVRWTGAFVASLAWLILALSVGAVLLLLTLLRRGSAVRVSSLFYLVPPATALEAYVLLGERLSAPQLLGMLLAVCGVALVMAAPAGRPAAALR